MNNVIFLSASVPDSKRNPIYYKTADLTAIREAVRALTTYILPKTTLIWGGHPAITPMIRAVADNIGVNVQDRVILYQTLFYEKKFPTENEAFAQIIKTPNKYTKKDSLSLMRFRMLTEHEYSVGVFIGGMEGVELEFELFRKYQPNAKVLPVYSTGGAAQILFDKYKEEFSLANGLKDDYAYFSLFRSLIKF